MCVDFDVRDNRAWIFFTGGSVIMDYGLTFETKATNWMLNDAFVSFKRAGFVFSRCSLMVWSGVGYCDVFISCLDSHSDVSPNLKKKQTHLHLGCLKTSNQIKSNQITFIVTSPQHKCLGE